MIFRFVMSERGYNIVRGTTAVVTGLAFMVMFNFGLATQRGRGDDRVSTKIRDYAGSALVALGFGAGTGYLLRPRREN